MKGLIFSVKRYSIHDGPGIRVTFFMKGCPLSCWWCHNPEGLSPLQETVVQTDRIGDREFSRNEEAGKYYSVEDLLDILDRERVFIEESKGGVTFSGGEPMLQTEFLKEALIACKSKGCHTAVDTSGYSQQTSYESIIPFTDLFLFDLKQMDGNKHILYTGVNNTLILENFRFLISTGKDIMVRIPVIPGLNDDDENLEALKKLLEGSAGTNLKKISLLPYHKIGSSKYNRFNIPYRMNGIDTPSSLRMAQIKSFFEETGLKIKIGG
jgi:pyruvate formate lyase activating enzyme